MSVILKLNHIRLSTADGVDDVTAIILSANTIYHVIDAYDLEGKTLNTPENVKFKFEGGSFYNGKLIGNQTQLEDARFYKIDFDGTFSSKCYVSMFIDESDDDKFTQALILASICQDNTLYVDGEYTLNKPVIITKCNIKGESACYTKNIINYTGKEAEIEEEACIIIRSASKYSFENPLVSNLLLRYVNNGVEVKRVASIELDNVWISRAARFENIEVENFTSYIIRIKGDSYFQEGYVNNVRGTHVGGFIGYYEPDGEEGNKFAANVVSFSNCSIDVSLNEYMVETVCFNMKGFGNISLREIVMQGYSGASINDVINEDGSTTYNWRAIQVGFNIGSANYCSVMGENIWFEFHRASSLFFSGTGVDMIKITGLRGIDSFVIDETVKTINGEIWSGNYLLFDLDKLIDDRSDKREVPVIDEHGNIIGTKWEGISTKNLTLHCKIYHQGPNEESKYEGDKKDKIPKAFQEYYQKDGIRVFFYSHLPSNLYYQSYNIQNKSESSQYGMITSGKGWTWYNKHRSLQIEEDCLFTRFNNNSLEIQFGKNFEEYEPRTFTYFRYRVSLADNVTPESDVDISLNVARLNAGAIGQVFLGGGEVLNADNRTTGWKIGCVGVDSTMYWAPIILEAQGGNIKYNDINIDISHIKITYGFDSFIDQLFLTERPSEIKCYEEDIEYFKSYKGEGEFFIITENGRYHYKNEKLFASSEYDISLVQVGISANRPVLSKTNVGFQYFDTSLKKYIVWDGEKWANFDGSILQ